MSHQQKKTVTPHHSSEAIKRAIEKNHVSPEELNKTLDELVKNHKSAIKELAKK